MPLVEGEAVGDQAGEVDPWVSQDEVHRYFEGVRLSFHAAFLAVDIAPGYLKLATPEEGQIEMAHFGGAADHDDMAMRSCDAQAVVDAAAGTDTVVDPVESASVGRFTLDRLVLLGTRDLHRSVTRRFA